MLDRAVMKPVAEYEQDVLIGGNHLASQLNSLGVRDMAALRSYCYDDVLKEFGQPIADVWVAWRAILIWRDARERFAGSRDGRPVGSSPLDTALQSALHLIIDTMRQDASSNNAESDNWRRQSGESARRSAAHYATVAHIHTYWAEKLENILPLANISAAAPSRREPSDLAAQIRALIERWRIKDFEKSSDPMTNQWRASRLVALAKCADELESALLPPEGQP